MFTVLLFAMLFASSAKAADYISDVMLIGHDNNSSAESLVNSYESQGWTRISRDLNDEVPAASGHLVRPHGSPSEHHAQQARPLHQQWQEDDSQIVDNHIPILHIIAARRHLSSGSNYFL